MNNKILFLNKKGFVVDGISMAIGFCIIIILMFVFFMASTTINEQQQNDPNLNNQQKAIFESAFGSAQGTAWDNGFMIGFALLIMFLLYSAYVIGTTPIFFVIAIAINGAFLLVLPALETFLVATVYNNNYVDAIAAFPKLTWVVNNFTVVFVTIASLTFLALYLRPSGQQ